MRFTRFSSDGDSVVQERIWLRLQREERQRPRVKEKLLETRSFPSGGQENVRSAARCHVLEGIDELMRSASAAA
jgi:hypothetical protein